MTEPEPDGRRAFGATLALGVVTAGAAALAGNQSWATVREAGEQIGGSVATVAVAADRAEAPLVTAVALVVLATWGVLLVTRGWFRRVVAWLGMAAAVALLVATVATWWEAPATVEAALAQYGVTDAEVWRTWWSWLGGAAAVLSVAAAWLAVRTVGGWPEMGRRFDAPGDEGPGDDDASASDRSSMDLWKSIDEGRDPTG